MSQKIKQHLWKNRFFYIAPMVVVAIVIGVYLSLLGGGLVHAVSGVTLADNDTTGYGLDGRDFTISWTPPGEAPSGFTGMYVFITTSTVTLTTTTVNTTGCGGSPCMAVGMYMHHSGSSLTAPMSKTADSFNTTFVTNTSYIAWVYTAATDSTIVSSSPVSYADSYDATADTSAPFLDHMSANSAIGEQDATLYAFVYDDQTPSDQFGVLDDGGSEYLWLYYGADVSVSSATTTGVQVNGELFSFVIPAVSVPAAGGSFEYFIVANDRSNNPRYFCVNPSATSLNDCKSSPMVVPTYDAGSISITGSVISSGNGQPVVGAYVFSANMAKTAVTTTAEGNFTISGVPANNNYDVSAMATGHCKAMRSEYVGTTNKAGVVMSLNAATNCGGFYDPGQGMGGQPHVKFTGPPDNTNGVPVDIKIRVGFDQPMMPSGFNGINDANAADASSNIYLTTDDGTTRIAGSVLYCESINAPGCSSYLVSGDTNTAVFIPSSNLATSTLYTLVINNNVTSQSMQSIQGNQPGVGHKISFTTVGNVFNDFNVIQGSYGQSGQYMPPFVRSMTPAPGMTAAPNVGILLEFNDAMSVSTINSTIITLWKSGVQVTDGVAVSLDSNESRFASIGHGDLTSGEYEVRVLGAASNVGGLPMRTPTSSVAFSSRFMVAGSNDSTAPTIYPALSNNSTGVLTNKIFEFGFNEQLAFSTINSTNVTLKRGATSESVSVNYDPGRNSVFVAPANILAPNTVYTIAFNAGVTDLAGNHLATSTYTYTTGNADTTGPLFKEARCDDYRCTMVFNESMNSNSQLNAYYWASSVINQSNWTIERTAPSSATISIAGKPMTYDAFTNSVTVEGVAGLAAGDSFRVTASSSLKDISENLIVTSSNQNIFNGSVEDSKATFGSFGDCGMFGPPTENMMGAGQIGQGEFKPQGFGSFTADQFAMGQADMAYPFNPMASADVNVFQTRFIPGVALQAGDQVVITFPAGTTVTNAAFDTQSPYYTDYNQFMAGTVSGTAISADNTTGKVTITLGVSGTPSANDQITIDLRKITNPAIPKGPSTGGYTVGIKVLRSGAALASKTSMPYFIMAGGTNTLVVDVVAGSATTTPTNGASGTVYLHGGGPGGPMEKMLTMTNGDISAIDGDAGTAITYSNLPDGCYGIGTEPYITLGGNDYYGQMAPEPICLSSGESKTKWILLSPTSGGNTATITVKMVDASGDPFVFSSKDIDIFAGGPNRFVVKTLTGVTTTASAGYQIKLNSNGNWWVGMGPSMPKGTSGGMPTSLGVMPPPSLGIMISNIDTSPTVAVSGTTPPGVTFSNGTITFIFAAADKTISGTVRDGSNNALANVEVFIKSQGFGSPIFTQTDATGAFSLGVTSYGNYEIGIRKDGMPPTFKSVEVRNDGGTKVYMEGRDVTSNLILTLKKASYTISGKVLDSSNNGISYAPVMAIDANGNNVFGQTSSDGSYTLYVDNGTWTVKAELPPSKTDACGTFSKTVTVAGSSQSSQNITPTVSTCYSLGGTVSVGGVNLANVPLFVEEWDSTNNRPLGSGAKKGASTDSNGAYSVKVGVGTYRIGTWHPDYGELSVTTTVSGTATQNLTVAATGNITFSFTGGTSAMNGFIELKNATDQNKRFGKSVSGLNSSVVMAVQSDVTYNYFVDVFGVGKFSGTATAGDTKTINLGVDSGFVTVTGTVYDGSDNAKAGALVTFANASTTVSVVTDANGLYSANLKAGTYTITDALSGYVAPQAASVAFTTSTAAYDFGGGSADQPALAVAGYTVTGTIYASDGTTPMTSGYVWGTNASSTVVSSPISATDGTYSLPVINGVWTIKAVGPRHVETTRSGTVTVSGASQTGKNITLTAASAGANVPTSTTGIVTASSGGSLNDSGTSGIKLTAGAGVLETGSGDVTLNFERTYTAPDTQNYQALGNASFSISASGDSTIKDLNGNAEIQLDYTSLLSSLPAGVSESDLQLAYYSPERGEYVTVEGGFTVDTTNNTITGLVDHFTDFVITYTNNTAGVTVTEGGGSTAVTEGGTTDSITYVLTSAPSANVVITPSASGSKVTLSPSSLTFTTANWTTPQTLTVTAVDDSSVEGTHTDTITHLIASSDTNYSGVTISNITVTITDNDSSGSGGSPTNNGDTTPPSSTSVLINGSATSTASRNVTLTLGASDAASMSISNTADFVGSIWETYGTSKAWTLTDGAGTKTVYARFRDANNNVSTAVSDTIVLLSTSTTTTPTATSTPATTPSSTLPVTPVVPVVSTPASTQPSAAVTVSPAVVVSNVSSKIAINTPTDASYQPGEHLKFNYQYKNEGTKRVTVKIVRQLLNAKGKAVKSMTAYKSISAGKAFKGVVNDVLSTYLPAGEYTEKITITNGKKVEINSFKITIEKLKKKYFVKGEIPADTDIAFDAVKIGSIKSNVLLPVNLKAKYTYTNNSGAKHTVKIVRELLGPDGKAIVTRTGRWVMKVGETDSTNFTQSLAKYLDAGAYQIRIRAYDWTTKELLAENSLGLTIELK